MRNCKRCKTNESIKGSLNCSSCDERNKRHTAKMIADSNAKVSYSKPLTEYGSYGGLGSEWDRGLAGHLNNI